MIILSKEQIITLHSQLIADSGGTDGIRDDGLLESALSAPFQSFGNYDAYPSIQQKAARLAFGLVNNHAFIPLLMVTNALARMLCLCFSL